MTGREARAMERAESRFEARMKSVRLWREMGEMKRAKSEEARARREYADATMFFGLGLDIPEVS